jgi:Scaffold protein Nfu/NifU N terminal
MKYTVSPVQEILPESFGTGMYFHKGEPAELAKCPMAASLLKLNDVQSVFLGRDFITINKSGVGPW